MIWMDMQEIGKAQTDLPEKQVDGYPTPSKASFAYATKYTIWISKFRHTRKCSCGRYTPYWTLIQCAPHPQPPPPNTWRYCNIEYTCTAEAYVKQTSQNIVPRRSFPNYCLSNRVAMLLGTNPIDGMNKRNFPIYVSGIGFGDTFISSKCRIYASVNRINNTLDNGLSPVRCQAVI